jgi:hypothetical protein
MYTCAGSGQFSSCCLEFDARHTSNKEVFCLESIHADFPRGRAAQQERRRMTGTRVRQTPSGQLKNPIPYGEVHIILLFHGKGIVERTQHLPRLAEIHVGKASRTQYIGYGHSEQGSTHTMPAHIDQVHGEESRRPTNGTRSSRPQGPRKGTNRQSVLTLPRSIGSGSNVVTYCAASERCRLDSARARLICSSLCLRASRCRLI